jgi:hypothetical protein
VGSATTSRSFGSAPAAAGRTAVRTWRSPRRTGRPSTFHEAALAAGGTDDGAPGIREIYHPTYYRAFVLDPDGNNIEAVCHGEPG